MNTIYYSLVMYVPSSILLPSLARVRLLLLRGSGEGEAGITMVVPSRLFTLLARVRLLLRGEGVEGEGKARITMYICILVHLS